MPTRLIFILTLFGSAFLSFSIQPMLGKMLLPIVGGAPSGWIVAMAFFQLALLGGYTLSHLLHRLSPRLHVLTVLIVYAVGLLSLPAHLTDLADTSHGLSLAVLLLLTCTILIPFMALTATTSALLRLFSHTDQPTAHDPFYLFTASNAGSLIGLFIYPLLLEPFFNVSDLSRVWLIVYSAMMGCILLCLLITRQQTVPSVASNTTAQSHVSWPTRLSWFCLAFVPCSLSMGLSTMITTDIANFPLIWTLPLGLYLLSFILGFAQRPLITLPFLHLLHVVCAALVIFFIVLHPVNYGLTFVDMIIDLLVLLTLFFVMCWSCHQTLAAQRPAAHHVTLYYLMIALGGAVAGSFNAFVVPLVLNHLVEFYISAIASLGLPMMFNLRVLPLTRRVHTYAFLGLLLLGLMMIYVIRLAGLVNVPHADAYSSLASALLMIALLGLVFKPRYLMILCIAVVCYAVSLGPSNFEIMRQRNFFGSTVVLDIPGGSIRLHSLRHGNTTHGMAEYDARGKATGNMAMSYYVAGGPLTDVYTWLKPPRVAVMGLGTGQVACFAPMSHLTATKTTYFEIDPAMVTIAQMAFPYLAHCPVDHIILGDARLEFVKQKQLYDLLILDVFSSDAIPVHIITLEALQQYRQHMTPTGLMMFHISNRYLDLGPQIAASAHIMGLPAYIKLHQPDRAKYNFALSSQWVAVPLHATDGENLVKAGWTLLDPRHTTAWTDDRSSLLTALRFVFKDSVVKAPTQP